MSFPGKQSKPLFIFYLLVAYICLQLAWWAFMLLSSNNELHQYKKELILLKKVTSAEIVAAEKELDEKRHKRWLMIIGEGSVFLVLLLLGIVKTRNAFKKEAALSDQQKNFLLSVTHELKSPLASAKLSLQTLLKRDLEKEKQNSIISHALSDTERLNNLVDNLLLAARIDNGPFPLHKEETDLTAFISETLEKTSGVVQSNNSVMYQLQPGIIYPIDRLAFYSILLNLFENAVKYSLQKSTLTIECLQHNQHVFIRFIDEGIGIPEHEKRFVFKKFYRIGNEETRKTKGTGLGLYIVKYLVERHNGSISVKNNSPKGSIFEIRLPID